MNLNDLKDRAYNIAKAHGWHDKELSDETYLMLIITEIAEAVNADRKGIRPDIEGYKEFMEAHDETAIPYAFDDFIKGSVEEELADVVIRCLDFAGMRGWDLQHVLDNVQDISYIKDFFQEHTFASVSFDICTDIILPEPKEAVRRTIAYICQYCLWRGIDIEWHIEQKMKYNELRAYKHGNKKY